MELFLEGLTGAFRRIVTFDRDVLEAASASLAGFGAVISEIGASLMTGCNVKGDTRILTTAIALETSKGEFGSAYALAFILLALVFAVSGVTTWAQQRPRPL